MNRRSRGSHFRRSGCTTCKHRHKKCDEQRPRCGNCTRLNLECQPPELFRASALSRSSKKTREDTFLNLSVDSLSDDCLAQPRISRRIDYDTHSDDGVLFVVPHRSSFVFDTDLLRSQSVVTNATPQASSLERYLLHHYTDRMSKVLINVDSASNPLRNVLIPRAMSSPVLMDALYATAAYHAFVGNQDPDFKIASMAYYNRATVALQRQIASIDHHIDKIDPEILLLTSVFLCKCDIIAGGVSDWRSHLQGVQRMFDIFKDNQSKMAPEAVSCLLAFSITSVSQGLRGLKAYNPPPEYPQGYEFEDVGQMGGRVDPYMGISRELLLLLRVATETMMLDPVYGDNLSVMMSNVMKIYLGVKSQARSPGIDRPTNGFPAETIKHLNHVASAYRNILVVYMHIILDAIEAEMTTESFALQYPGIRQLFTVTKDAALSACIQDMVWIPEDSTCAVGLVPLLFILACETKSPIEFDFASTRLTTILRRACLGNIGSALELLQKTQHAGSSNWRQVLKASQWDLIVT